MKASGKTRWPSFIFRILCCEVKLLLFSRAIVRMQAAARLGGSSSACNNRVNQRILIKIPLGEQQHSMRHSIRHLIEGCVAVIGEGVASQMIARIVWGSSCATIGRCLRGCLYSFSPCEQTACRDAIRDKRPVV